MSERLTIHQARQVRMRNLVDHFADKLTALYDARAEALLYNPPYAPKERIVRNRRCAVLRSISKLMEALTS